MGTYNVPATSPSLDAELVATSLRAGGLRAANQQTRPGRDAGPYRLRGMWLRDKNRTFGERCRESQADLRQHIRRIATALLFLQNRFQVALIIETGFKVSFESVEFKLVFNLYHKFSCFKAFQAPA